MKTRFLIFILSGYAICAVAQNMAPTSGKPPIDSGVYNKWPSIQGEVISHDGKYAWYVINNQPAGGKSTVILSTDGKWKKTFVGDYGIRLGNNGAYLLTKGDSLNLMKLRKNGRELITGVASSDFFDNPKGQWLAYKSLFTGELTVRNLTSKKVQKFEKADNYIFGKTGAILLLQTKSEPRQNKDAVKFQWIDLKTGAINLIWEGKSPENITFDRNESAVAFIVKSVKENQVWFFKEGMSGAEIVAEDQMPGIDHNLTISSIRSFSNDGKRVFISLKERDPDKPNPDAVKLDIWTYKDMRSQTSQLEALVEGNYNAAILVKEHKVIMLTDELSGGFFIPGSNNDDWAISDKYIYPPGSDGAYNGYLIFTKDGSRKKAPTGGGLLSPNGNYLVYYDYVNKSFVSYETHTGITQNITQNTPLKWDLDEQNGGYGREIVAGWMKDDQSVLLYDDYDIWKVHLAGADAPVNLTNGYGRKYHIMFSLSGEDRIKMPFINNEQVILTAFDLSSKDNGFYKMTINKKSDPEMLTMGPYAYSLGGNGYVPNSANFEPIKAMNAAVYIVQRQSSTESPNLFVTRDFKSFRRLSDVHPERDYNWYTTELYQWKTPDGKTTQGILYKPENFDSTKRYPVIFYYYTMRSDNLHAYMVPEVSDGRLNISWYVSNGYLVFTPDIHYTDGEAYESCYNSIVSAAHLLSALPFVDSTKMAIQGMSWGGFETNYLVTHTHIFAAACSASSIADFISNYNSYTGGSPLQSFYDIGGHGPGATLWEKPEWYIKNSPVMSADKVTTPLLMFETTKDDDCLFVNALELYSALRRLGKKVWMLEYNDGNHGVSGKDAMDFDLRMQQFFDYYLKNAPPPKWMTEGRPAKLKGIDDRLELDLSGATP